MKLSRNFITTSLIPACLILAACGGGGSSSGSAPTTVSFGVTDAPVDNVSAVQVTIDGIAMKPAEGETVIIDFDPITISNLLDFTGDNATEILGDREVPPGEYRWLRLFVQGGLPDSKVVEDAGGEFDLFLPGQQNGNGNRRRFLHLNRGFTVAAGGASNFTIDFVLRKALTKPSSGNHYLLRPSLRLVNNLEVGGIGGTVAESLINDSSCTSDPATDEGNAVYLYAGDVFAPDDVLVTVTDPEQGTDEEASNRPISTAEVLQEGQTGAYRYRFGFIPTGNYTVAFTCQSLDDSPDTDDRIAFIQPAGVSVTSSEVAQQNFVTEQP